MSREIAVIEAQAAVIEAQAERIRSLEAENAAIHRSATKLADAARGLFSDVDEVFASLKVPFEEARDAKSDRQRRRIERAVALRDSGLSASQIGLRMALEDGRIKDGEVRVYPERTVRKWLALERRRGDVLT